MNEWPRDPAAFKAYLMDWQEVHRDEYRARYDQWRTELGGHDPLEVLAADGGV